MKRLLVAVAVLLSGCSSVQVYRMGQITTGVEMGARGVGEVAREIARAAEEVRETASQLRATEKAIAVYDDCPGTSFLKVEIPGTDAWDISTFGNPAVVRVGDLLADEISFFVKVTGFSGKEIREDEEVGSIDLEVTKSNRRRYSRLVKELGAEAFTVVCASTPNSLGWKEVDLRIRD